MELERSFVHDAHWPGAYHAACYDAQGERAATTRVYHTLRVRLQDELHVLPGPRTKEFYASIRRAPVTPTGTRTVLSVERRRQPRRPS